MSANERWIVGAYGTSIYTTTYYSASMSRWQFQRRCFSSAIIDAIAAGVRWTVHTSWAISALAYLTDIPVKRSCYGGYPAFRRMPFRRMSNRRMSFRRISIRRTAAPISFVSSYPIRRSDIRRNDIRRFGIRRTDIRRNTGSPPEV